MKDRIHYGDRTDAILASLRAHRTRVFSDLCADTDSEPKDVSATLCALMERGCVERVSRGVYRIAVQP